MTIEMPIKINGTRPMTRPESPYGQCGKCQYVGIDAVLGGSCPKCGATFVRSVGVWPSVESVELWDDIVFAYNHERAELAAVASAMYFEAHVFDLIRWGTRWLDPDLNWLGTPFQEVKDKAKRITQYLDTIRSPYATAKALERLFGVRPRQMLDKILGADAKLYWENYQRLADLRNAIVHKGTRLSFKTCDVGQTGGAAQQILVASITFVPECWVVFARLWNEYIHRPILASS